MTETMDTQTGGQADDLKTRDSNTLRIINRNQDSCARLAT